MFHDLSQEELIRYSRHLVMPEVGLKGQRKLKNSSVLIVGTGGLGSPISLYLAAAGMGHIGLVDYDKVDESNLQRQIIHDEHSIGKKKVESAKKRLTGLNSFIQIDSFHEIFSSKNAEKIAQEFDILVDGTDNFPTRYLLNDLGVLTGKPYIYGSVFRFEGQLSVFDAKKGPCYRCLFPEPPEPGMVPSCAEGGVLGVMPGIIGTLQAIEVIKIILGVGEPLIGKLLLVDALSMEFQTIQFQKNHDCMICGEKPVLKTLIDYEDFCGAPFVNVNSVKLLPENEISPEELKKKIDSGVAIKLIDVRAPVERQISNLPNAEFLPLENLAEITKDWDRNLTIIAFCRTGTRSARAVDQLIKLGFKDVKHLTGGINAWAKKINSKINQY
jgi:adenylyltransferase/sulfurtransferase